MVFNRWLAPRFKQKADLAAADQGEAALGQSLKVRSLRTLTGADSAQF